MTATASSSYAAATSPPPARTVALRVLLAHEWRLLVRDRLLPVATALFAVVVVLALVAGSGFVRVQRATLATLRAAEAAQYDAMRRALDTIPATAAPPERFARDPRSPFHVGARIGRVATLDPAPLAVLAIGQADLQSAYFTVTTGARQAMLMKDELENPVNLLTGRLDLAFVLAVLLPLLVGALTYGLLASEREAGTLALVAAQPVSLARIVAAKVLVRAAIVLALAVGLVAVGLVVAGVPLGAPGTASLAAFALGAVVLYAAFWFAIAVAIGARAPSAAAGALTYAVAWLALVIVVPVAANAIAQQRHPAPSRTALIAQSRAVSAAANARADTVLRRFLYDHPELARGATLSSGAEFAARSLAVNAEIDAAMAPPLVAFDSALAAQQAIVDRARVVAPSLLVQAVLEGVAGTDGARWRAFRDGTVAFHERWRGAIVAHVVADRLLDRRAYETLPAFDAPAQDVAATLARVRPAFAALALLTVAAIVAALLSLRGVRAIA